MSPFFSALMHWAEMFANGAVKLDPLTRARLDALAGRSVAVEVSPPGETATIYFENRLIRLDPGIGATPSVIIRGNPTALATAFFGISAPRNDIVIEGDELVLDELRGIVRNFHPERIPPLEQFVSQPAAEAIMSVIELGFAAVSAFGRGVGEESGRIVRSGARQRYLATTDFEAWLASIQALRVRMDRLSARTEIVEQAAGGRNEMSEEPT